VVVGLIRGRGLLAVWMELTDGVRVVNNLDVQRDELSLAVVGDIHEVRYSGGRLAGRQQQQASREGLGPDIVLTACLSSSDDSVDVNLGRGVISCGLDGQGSPWEEPWLAGLGCVEGLDTLKHGGQVLQAVARRESPIHSSGTAGQVIQ